MVLIIVFLTALALLYILTKQILKTITAFAHHVTRSTHIAVAFLSLLLYPGTIVHEMAHLITALILLVPIKGLKLEPVVKHGYIRAGSVATQHTDWLRQIFISIAPLPFGITILWLLSQRAFPDLIDASQQFIEHQPPSDIFATLQDYRMILKKSLTSLTMTSAHSFVYTGILVYFFFTVSASMFPSSTDLKLLHPLTWLITILGTICILYLLPSYLSLLLVLTLVVPLMLHILAYLLVSILKFVL